MRSVPMLKVKILVAVDPEGKWMSAGFGEEGEIDYSDIRECIILDGLKDPVKFYWIEAEVAVPVEQVVKGKATDERST